MPDGLAIHLYPCRRPRCRAGAAGALDPTCAYWAPKLQTFVIPASYVTFGIQHLPSPARPGRLCPARAAAVAGCLTAGATAPAPAPFGSWRKRRKLQTYRFYNAPLALEAGGGACPCPLLPSVRRSLAGAQRGLAQHAL
jgi:hypothetical protein